MPSRQIRTFTKKNDCHETNVPTLAPIAASGAYNGKGLEKHGLRCLSVNPTGPFFWGGDAGGLGNGHFDTQPYHFLWSCFCRCFFSFLAQWPFPHRGYFVFLDQGHATEWEALQERDCEHCSLRIHKATLRAAVPLRDTSGKKGYLITHLLQLLSGN